MIKKDSFGSQYNFLANTITSWSASSRGTILLERSKHWTKRLLYTERNSIIIIIIIQFFIIYVPCEQLQGQLQTQHSVDTINCITDKQKERQMQGQFRK
jgi:hypothetical protein